MLLRLFEFCFLPTAIGSGTNFEHLTLTITAIADQSPFNYTPNGPHMQKLSTFESFTSLHFMFSLARTHIDFLPLLLAVGKCHWSFVLLSFLVEIENHGSFTAKKLLPHPESTYIKTMTIRRVQFGIKHSCTLLRHIWNYEWFPIMVSFLVCSIDHPRI